MSYSQCLSQKLGVLPGAACVCIKARRGDAEVDQRLGCHGLAWLVCPEQGNPHFPQATAIAGQFSLPTLLDLQDRRLEGRCRESGSLSAVSIDFAVQANVSPRGGAPQGLRSFQDQIPLICDMSSREQELLTLSTARNPRGELRGSIESSQPLLLFIVWTPAAGSGSLCATQDSLLPHPCNQVQQARKLGTKWPSYLPIHLCSYFKPILLNPTLRGLASA